MKTPMPFYPKITSLTNTAVFQGNYEKQPETVIEAIIEDLAKSKKEYLFNAVGSMKPNAKIPNCNNIYHAMIIIMTSEILKYSHDFSKKDFNDFSPKIIKVMNSMDLEYINQQYLKDIGKKKNTSDNSKLYKTEQELADEAEDGCAGGACKI